MASLAQMTNNEPALGFGSGVRFNDNSSVSKSGPKMLLFVLIALVRKFLVKAGGPYGAIAAVVTKMFGKKMFGSMLEADETGDQTPTIPPDFGADGRFEPPPLPRRGLFGGGGGGGGRRGPRSSGSLQIFFPDFTQLLGMAMLAVLAYVGWQLVKAAKQMNKYRKALDMLTEMAQAPDGAGNIGDLRKMLAILCQEAENAGGRDNTEAMVYRIGQVYKRVDEANKTIWAVKKDLQQMQKKKRDDNWEE